MRYRRRRRFKSRVIRMKFQSFIDISTQADNLQIISVNAGGPSVVDRLLPFFQAYKYYKLGGVSIKLIPASTLPVDPTGLSIEAGEQTVDPRDQLTPGMCRITNGEDILEDITGMTGNQQRQLYENMLLDPRWYKWMLQSGVKRYGKPRYWQIGQLHQDKWPTAIQNSPVLSSSTETVTGTQTTYKVGKTGVSPDVWAAVGHEGSSAYGIFQTGHRGVLGWLPTDSLQPVYKTDGVVREPFYAAVPEVELFKILMPPMHKTNYWYRCFITEEVLFREPVVMNVNGYRPLDVFHTFGIGRGEPKLPSQYQNNLIDTEKTGGNYGDD